MMEEQAEGTEKPVEAPLPAEGSRKAVSGVRGIRAAFLEDEDCKPSGRHTNLTPGLRAFAQFCSPAWWLGQLPAGCCPPGCGSSVMSIANRARAAPACWWSFAVCLSVSG